LRDGAGGRASDRGYIGRRARHCPIRLGCVFQQGEIDSIGERVALTRPALVELHEIFLGQGGGALELVAGKH